MSDNTDVIKRGYEAFNNGDAEALSEVFADDIQWEGPNAEGVPMSGKHDGKDAVLQALGQIGERFEAFNVRPDELIEEGDTVVVLSHLEAKARNGNEVKLPGAEVYRMSGGKIKRAQSLSDTAELQKALGS
jgi:ketosteroid isomerase-like protein